MIKHGDATLRVESGNVAGALMLVTIGQGRLIAVRLRLISQQNVLDQLSMRRAV